jgi:hypothetical protein
MDDRLSEFELALGGSRGQRHIPLSQVAQPYKVTISGARRVKLPSKKKLAVRSVVLSAICCTKLCSDMVSRSTSLPRV